MGVSKPQAYCQELQLAAGRAKLSGGYGPPALSSRNEHRTGKKNSSLGTGAPRRQKAQTKSRKRSFDRPALRVKGPGVFPSSRPSVNSNLSRTKGSGRRCRAGRRAKIERPN